MKPHGKVIFYWTLQLGSTITAASFILFPIFIVGASRFLFVPGLLLLTTAVIVGRSKLSREADDIVRICADVGCPCREYPVTNEECEHFRKILSPVLEKFAQDFIRADTQYLAYRLNVSTRRDVQGSKALEVKRSTARINFADCWKRCARQDILPWRDPLARIAWRSKEQFREHVGRSLERTERSESAEKAKPSKFAEIKSA